MSEKGWKKRVVGKTIAGHGLTMKFNKDGSFNDKNLSTVGYLAIGVPGTVAGLWEVHQKFGSLPW